MIDHNYGKGWRDLQEESQRKRKLITGLASAALAGILTVAYHADKVQKIVPKPIKIEKITLDNLLNGAPKEVREKIYHFKDINDESIRIENYVKQHPAWFERLVNLGNSAAGLEGEYRMSQQDLAAALGAESRLTGKNKGQLTKPAYKHIVNMITPKLGKKKNRRYNQDIAELFNNSVPSPHQAFNDEKTNLYVCGAYLISLVPKYTSTENNPTKLDPRVCAIWEYNWGNDVSRIVKHSRSAEDAYEKIADLERNGVATAFLDGIRYAAVRINGQEAIQQRTGSPASAHSRQTQASAQTQHR